MKLKINDDKGHKEPQIHSSSDESGAKQVVFLNHDDIWVI
jgi:hypothetical protein